MDEDSHNDEIVSSIVSLGKSLGLNVVAEEIETKEQYFSVKALGCDEAQGYLYSKPVQEAEIGKLLTSLVKKANRK